MRTLTLLLFLFSTNMASADPKELLVIVCQVKTVHHADPPYDAVAIFEQIDPDGGNMLAASGEGIMDVGIDAKVTFYKGSLEDSTVEQIAINDNFIESVPGNFSRTSRGKVTFSGIDNGVSAQFMIDYDREQKFIMYQRTDVSRVLDLDCGPRSSVSDVFPNRVNTPNSVVEDTGDLKAMVCQLMDRETGGPVSGVAVLEQLEPTSANSLMDMENDAGLTDRVKATFRVYAGNINTDTLEEIIRSENLDYEVEGTVRQFDHGSLRFEGKEDRIPVFFAVDYRDLENAKLISVLKGYDFAFSCNPPLSAVEALPSRQQ